VFFRPFFARALSSFDPFDPFPKTGIHKYLLEAPLKALRETSPPSHMHLHGKIPPQTTRRKSIEVPLAPSLTHLKLQPRCANEERKRKGKLSPIDPANEETFSAFPLFASFCLNSPRKAVFRSSIPCMQGCRGSLTKGKMRANAAFN